MATPFNEIEMMILSQLSYKDTPAKSFDNGNAKISLAEYIEDNRAYLERELGSDAKSSIDSLFNKVSGANESSYTIVKSSADKYKTGFSAFAVEGPEEGTVTVAARGTEFGKLKKDPGSALRDLATDAELGFASETDQQDKMNDFMKDLEGYDSVYMTGHSLGGNLAVSGAVSFDYPEKIKGVYTFNAPGQNSAFLLTHGKGAFAVADKITNYQNEGDMISDINIPIGNTVVVKTDSKDSSDLTNNFKNHGMGDMKISNGSFATKGSKGASHYIGGAIVSTITAGLSSAALITGLGGIFLADEVGPALKKVGDWCGEKAKAAGEWIGNAYDDAKEWVGEAVDDIKDGAKAVGKAIVDGAEEVGEAIWDGAKAVGSGIAKGAKAVGDGISNAYEYVTGTGRYNNDLIFVNTEGLREEANKMRNYQQEYTNVMQKITNLIITLKQNNIWDTPATTTFIDNYVELKEVFDKFGRVMTEYSSILEGVSERMQTTDNTMSTKFENLSL